MDKKNKMDKIIAVMIITLALLFVNYIYTFSGFVAYTSEERRAAQLLDNLFETEPNSEARKEVVERWTGDDKKMYGKYKSQYKASNSRHKTIQQFYLEEGFILLLSILVIFYTRKT